MRLDCHTFENLFILPKYIEIKNTHVLWISSLCFTKFLKYLSRKNLNKYEGKYTIPQNVKKCHVILEHDLDEDALRLTATA